MLLRRLVSQGLGDSVPIVFGGPVTSNELVKYIGAFLHQVGSVGDLNVDVFECVSCQACRFCLDSFRYVIDVPGRSAGSSLVPRRSSPSAALMM